MFHNPCTRVNPIRHKGGNLMQKVKADASAQISGSRNF